MKISIGVKPDKNKILKIDFLEFLVFIYSNILVRLGIGIDSYNSVLILKERNKKFLKDGLLVIILIFLLILILFPNNEFKLFIIMSYISILLIIFLSIYDSKKKFEELLKGTLYKNSILERDYCTFSLNNVYINDIIKNKNNIFNRYTLIYKDILSNINRYINFEYFRNENNKLVFCKGDDIKKYKYSNLSLSIKCSLVVFKDNVYLDEFFYNYYKNDLILNFIKNTLSKTNLSQEVILFEDMVSFSKKADLYITEIKVK